MVVIVNARNVRNGWGVNVGGPATNIATALKFINTRWIRYQFDGDVTSNVQSIQNALVSVGAPDPTLQLNLLLNGYNQNATTNTFANQSNWILNGINTIVGPSGKRVLKAIEGPNEMNSPYTGNGCRGPNDTIDKTGSGNVVAPVDSVAAANLVDWAHQAFTLRQNNSALSGVELISGTVLQYTGTNFPTTLNCSQYVDYGTFHYYAGINGNNGCPSWPTNPGNFYYSYGFAQAGICPGKGMCQTEGGTSTQIGGGYGQDGRSSARYEVMQILDHHATGGHRYMIYNLFNNPISTQVSVTGYNEDNFGQYYGDYTTPKASATALHNLGNLLSIGNDYSNAANFTDTATFTPAYTGAGFSINGLANAGSAGSAMILPKSDGSTMIAIWNEPTIDTGSGSSASVSDNAITVNFGSVQTYKVYDSMGGGNANAFTVSTNAVSSPIIGQTTGSSVNLTLRGNPLFIELSGAPAATQAPGASVLSKGLTTATEQTAIWTAGTNQPSGYKLTLTRVS